MEEYKSNSFKSKGVTPTTESKKVVTGAVKVKKKTGVQKAASVFVSEDVHKIKDHIIYDTLIPAIKKGIFDIITDSIHMAFFGGSTPANKSSNYGPATRINYSSQYNSSNDRFSNNGSTRVVTSTSTYSFDSVGFKSPRDAEAVLNQLLNAIDRYKLVTVATFYEFCGLIGSHTDYKYGWKSLDGVHVYYSSDGYYKLNLPRAIPID